MHKKTLKMFGLMIAAVILTAGCTVGSEEVTYESQHPVLIGLAYDISGSTNSNGVPVVTIAHVDSLVDLIKSYGGTLAVAFIDDKGFDRLERLALDPVKGRLDERARLNAKQQDSVTVFRQRVSGLLSRPRNARDTDINGVIGRLTLFLEEPRVPANASRLVIFLSDGIDTVSSKKVKGIALPSNTTVIAIGMKKELALKLFGKKVLLFESVDAAIQAVPTFLNIEITSYGGKP